MTKKELEKEADKYADNYATPDLDCSFRAHMFEASALGYPAGAEPREKQIAELTEQNTSLLTSVENLNKSVQELEKKNVELKTDNSEWEKASDKWKNLYYSTNEQLTEAEVIIKDLMRTSRDCIRWYLLCDKANKFIREIKEK